MSEVSDVRRDTSGEPGGPLKRQGSKPHLPGRGPARCRGPGRLQGPRLSSERGAHGQTPWPLSGSLGVSPLGDPYSYHVGPPCSGPWRPRWEHLGPYQSLCPPQTPGGSTKLQPLGPTGLKPLLSKAHSPELMHMGERMTKGQREEREWASHRPNAARASGKGGALRAGSLRRQGQLSRGGAGGPQEICRQGCCPVRLWAGHAHPGGRMDSDAQSCPGTLHTPSGAQ